MSLLMEALKKAERAKQGQGEPTPAAPAETPPPAIEPAGELELSLQPQERTAAEPPPAAEAAPMPELRLDAEPAQAAPLPRIEPSLTPSEPAPATAPRVEAAARPTPRSQIPGHKPSPQAPARDARGISDAQQKARTVFAAKAPTPNRQILIAGAAGVVLLGLAGFGFYYWQLISGSSVATPGPAPQPAAVAAPVAAPVAEAPAPTPALPALQADAPPPAAPSPDVAHIATPTAAPGEAEAPRSSPAIQIRQGSTPNQINPSLSKAYQAYQAGDHDAAQQHYQKVLQQDANNRDALLGLAAIAQSRKQPGQAAALYTRLLELDPADPDALAGLVGTQGQADPVQSETRLKKILAQNPQAAAAHFALGNAYSQQSRWAEAQQAYFRAYSSAPGNADYAFNLAVSLDFLSQGKLALEYYQRALNLAKSGPANFDQAAAHTRIRELQQPAGE